MTEAYLLKERRVHPRISVKVPVDFRILVDPEEINNTYDWRKSIKHRNTMDVSLGGIFIVTDQPLKERNLLSLEITIPETKEKLSAMAEVVWTSESGGGIQFLAMKEEDMKTLTAYLAKASSSR
jgi:hypothetical protein